MPEPISAGEPSGPAVATIERAPAESDFVNPLIRVADVMTTDLRTCSPHSTVLEAVMFFRDADCGAIPIVDMGKPLGILTDRDVALALASYPSDLARLPVGDLMTPEIVSVNQDDTISVAMDLLGDHGIRRLLVVNGDGVLVGVLSWSDLAPHLSPCGLGRVLSRIVENR
ncbi:CBS domain-containing protein [Aquisphaera insulae]|uniref:CBS domain-containing protein n=1 Tax=Aquisphaera insulae TaxID=2712864 RepID=UPI0013EA9F82|nr:CBS domain-containing protein [Aquisphaera insulae]